MDRRHFFTTSAAAGILETFASGLTGIARTKEKGLLEKRTLGRTGEKLSILGFGGIVVRDATPEQADQRVRHAIDNGVNYFDVAPSYGNAEEKLGPALEPHRKGVFLACKTTERTAQGAETELHNSLGKMRTDHFDLYQCHAVTTMKDVQTILGPKGALETFQKAKREGKIRFLGFSAHSVEAALAMMDGFSFDTILFPINFATWNAGNFGPQVLERAQKNKMGILALKAMAKQPWQSKDDRKKYPKCWYEPLSDRKEAEMGLRFTLSHPITAAIPPGDENLFHLALELALQFHPLTDKESEDIKRKSLSTEPIFRYPSARPV